MSRAARGSRLCVDTIEGYEVCALLRVRTGALMYHAKQVDNLKSNSSMLFDTSSSHCILRLNQVCICSMLFTYSIYLF